MTRIEDILLSREMRAKRQWEWHLKYGIPLVSFSLNIPGAIKQSQLYARIHREGLAMLIGGINVVDYEENEFSTGSEAILAVKMDPGMLKEYTISLEENHPLGRLFDMDVFDEHGVALNRAKLGAPARSCLLCNNDAAFCRRSGAHTTKDLLEHIDRIALAYFEGKPMANNR